MQDITDEAIATLGLKCPGLTFLCASLCHRLTDASLVALGQGCPELTYVTVLLSTIELHVTSYSTSTFKTQIVFFFSFWEDVLNLQILERAIIWGYAD